MGMKQLQASCQGCGQTLFVDVDDSYEESDPLGLLRLVTCEQCLAKRYSVGSKPKTIPKPVVKPSVQERRLPYAD